MIPMASAWGSAIARAIVVALFLAFSWTVFRTEYKFVIRFAPTGLRVRKGRVSTAFLEELAIACNDFRLSRGWVGGVQRGKFCRLKFSRNAPLEFRQRIRNLWAIHK